MKKVLFILLIISALGCNKDESNPVTDPLTMNLVTGINFRQTTDDLPLKLGNPNILVNNKFLIYPNPAGQALNFLAEGNVTNIWFVPANPEKIHQNVNFSNILNTNIYSEQSIISNSDLSSAQQSSNNIIVNIKTLEKGYYKVFVKIGGEIYWDNFYKHETDWDEEKLSEITNFWD
ncbi:hypothetical protein [Flavobacterium sp.]|uniref:hypothetical protein n=1 Tax=Flavobacterium sp. TaxID=239 RepID=UPI002632D25C|nr:hypothetical protein [Flavobacterium sp.]